MITETRYKKFSWTKWGDRRGLLKEDLDEWTCQLCGRRHVKHLPSYFLPEDDLEFEYMRVCSICFHTALVLDILNFSELLSLRVANLLTLPAKY